MIIIYYLLQGCSYTLLICD
uniref:Uncharacterized protein n=1 Tax=Anguilla anguilla TaxID=7936 RepID=A0A0E9XRK5_ANGAN